MASVADPLPRIGPIHVVGKITLVILENVGDVTIFFTKILYWMTTRLPRKRVLLPSLYQTGVLSLPVVIVTGVFIGMVLAIQTYDQFRLMHMETKLGAIINISLVKELGPVLAATMLAGRVGSALAAELGTMRVTEQIDALSAMGANPVNYLVVPRFLACFTLIPLLTIVADATGILGGWFLSSYVLDINSHHYWHHAISYVGPYDLFCGMFKSTFFGAAIAVVACHRGFNCTAGAEGVGRAATEAFVFSFVLILVLDFALGAFLQALYYTLWPSYGGGVVLDFDLINSWTQFVS
ncbi:MlaE family ABC transporter permease [Symmachiella dynata]|uniref:ABC transport permease subunit MlaE n=1 Tax=Symmachiella dynata TaxID=2527995 RepID=A0A517ZNV2_9PLAN|nr:ABC transporter permease [Symmachiella dynata]QDT48499.1 ABC transport permease subunit MlaE [Symmachiella dynata]QDU44090.1 ABC transport permease subunit MlaE [Symmachiella dynata]